MNGELTIESGGTYYKVNAAGEIYGANVAPSGQWRLVGAVRYNNFGRQVERRTLADIQAGKIKDWTHANGAQRWHIMDLDHGTTRVWMGQRHRVYA